MYGVGKQLFRSPLAGLLAALFVAVSPLHIWYAQEVRMYTLLTFLCLLSGYLLLLVVESSQQSGSSAFSWEVWALWAGYVLTSVAAIYTHYFAFLVLGSQAFYVLLVWWGRGFRPHRLVAGGIASGVSISLAYLPWLPHFLTRWGADVSYWPGRLKLPEVLLDIAVFFVGGESVSEPVGAILALGSVLVLAVCYVAAAWHQRPREGSVRARGEGQPQSTSLYPLSFLLLNFLIPPILILALAYGSPKFNARYVMLSHPPLLLIYAGGLAALWQRRSSYWGNLVRAEIASVLLVFLLGVSAYANYNAYTDPTYTRADFRGAARHVAEHIGPGEAVILTSGHMYPIFDYYAPNVERYLLPDSPTLDTTRTLDYSIAAQLNDWLAHRDGVWVVLWQDEVVDPVGYLTTMLGAAGELQPDVPAFAQLEVRHYALAVGTHFSDQPGIDHPATFNYGDRLRLLGYSQTGDQQVTLFWQALQPLVEDYRVSVELQDVSGQIWGRWDGRPTSYLFPADRWRVGQVVFGHYDLSVMPGTPPGDYGLTVAVYTEEDPVGLDLLDHAGAPQGKRATLGAVRLSVLTVTADQVDVPHLMRANLGGGLQLLGWALDHDSAQPGDQLPLTLIWEVVSRPEADYSVHVQLNDAAGQALDAGTFPPTNVWHPTSRWDVGQAWRGQATFRLPIQAQPGRARIAVQLVDSSGSAMGLLTELSVINVLSTNRVFSPPEPQVLRPADFDDKIALLGADLPADTLTPGDPFQIILYWQALVEMDVPYSVFVHLLGTDGRVLAGHDGQPVGNTRPTTGWVPGEYVTDPHQVVIPADLPPGEYIIEVGLYDAGLPAFPRLWILGEEGQLETDRVIFGPVRIR
jgi:hypothetical protein